MDSSNQNDVSLQISRADKLAEFIFKNKLIDLFYERATARKNQDKNQEIISLCDLALKEIANMRAEQEKNQEQKTSHLNRSFLRNRPYFGVMLVTCFFLPSDYFPPFFTSIEFDHRGKVDIKEGKCKCVGDFVIEINYIRLINID